MRWWRHLRYYWLYLSHRLNHEQVSRLNQLCPRKLCAEGWILSDDEIHLILLQGLYGRLVRSILQGFDCNIYILLKERLHQCDICLCYTEHRSGLCWCCLICCSRHSSRVCFYTNAKFVLDYLISNFQKFRRRVSFQKLRMLRYHYFNLVHLESTCCLWIKTIKYRFAGY